MHFLTSDTKNWSGPVNIWSGPAASGSNKPDCLAAKKINVESCLIYFIIIEPVGNIVKIEENAGYQDLLFSQCCIPFPNNPLLLSICSISLLKLLVTSNFFLFPQCFLPKWRTFCHFHQS